METPWTSMRPRARILPAPVLDARDEARRLLSAAEQRAAELVDEAEHTAKSIRSAARDAGRDEGSPMHSGYWWRSSKPGSGRSRVRRSGEASASWPWP